ncbi:MAG TPA: hypothetical protein VH439_17505 [Gemmatimonadales bacterium]
MPTRKDGTFTRPTGHFEDNTGWHSKLALRRHFLARYHAQQKPVVLDCCQGEARIWTTLRAEFPCTYWGVDQEKKKGRLKIDSTRLLAQPALPYDVIDIDTYGSPWGHWRTLLPHVTKPTTVFLTLGSLKGNVPAIDHAVLDALGISKLKTKPPVTITWKFAETAVGACLGLALDYPLAVVEAGEALPASVSARYFGVRLEPAGNSIAYNGK